MLLCRGLRGQQQHKQRLLQRRPQCLRQCRGLRARSGIGSGSCNNGDFGCWRSGSRGSSVIGNGSCNRFQACDAAGAFAGSSVIGNGSCNNIFACYQVGEFGSSVIIGNGKNNTPGTPPNSCKQGGEARHHGGPLSCASTPAASTPGRTPPGQVPRHSVQRTAGDVMNRSGKVAGSSP